MKKENLEFCFKGNRTYIQGSDIFDAIVSKLASNFNLDKIENIKYSAHKMLKKNAFVLILEKFNPNDYKKINSVITFKNSEKKYYVVVIEDSREIECSVEYSEEIVRSTSAIIDKKIEFKNELEDSLTEIIVSMNKYYLQESVTKDGKWMVTKFDYHNLNDIQNVKGKMISLELKNNFNNKLTKSIVTVDGLVVGNLYFSLI